MRTNKLTNEKVIGKKRLDPYLFLLLFFLAPLYALAQPVGARITNPIVMGTYNAGTFSYSDTKNNSTGYGYLNDYGQSSDDIYYRFTVQGTARVDISHCTSGFDTYMHLLNSSGGLITYNDDNGPLCSGLKSSISITLAAGTYYIVSEGYSSNSGNITTSVVLVVDPPVGARITNPIVMGTYAAGSYSYSNTKNNNPANGFMNDYGQSSDDIYYQFTVQGSTQVNISHCSSGFDTYMHLLNGAGNLIMSNDDYGPLCPSTRASIQTTVDAGTYYIVSEGYGSYSGDIITAVTLLVQPPPVVYNGWNPSHTIGTMSGNYNSATISWPEQVVELSPAAIPNTGLTYQWEESTSPVTGFIDIPGATQTSYSLSNPGQTTYLRRKTIKGSSFIYSNTIKISMVSPNWEDINYVREHEVKTTGITTRQAVEQLPIGQKLETTTFMDGLGRSLQSMSRETATPANVNSLWGDVVRFSQYDVYGREPVQHLPYTTSSQSGKYKTAPSAEQPQYFSNTYNETSAATAVSYDNSPLNRVKNIKKPGTIWAASTGSTAIYDLNTTADNVRIFWADYVQGNPPVTNQWRVTYDANTLYKITTINETGKQVVEFINKSGQLILKKVQLDDNPSSSHAGWICTYFIYDDFGELRMQLQPEAVKYLEANNWSFGGANGQQILYEQCFHYDYDDKRRMIWKKAPGAAALRMMYDIRSRLVFTQDGNQETLPTPQWTATLYDQLDRPVITALYNTTKSISSLQSDINNATTISSVTVNNPGTYSVTATVSLNPLLSSELNNSGITTLLKYSFYDDYSFAAVKPFNTAFTNLSAYNTSDPNVVPLSWSKRTLNLPTGNMIRVLGSQTFLSSTVYYDEKEYIIQSLQDNIKSGIDITTFQYHFDGRVLSSCSDHTAPGTGYTDFKTLTKFLFDKLGRVNAIQKQFGGNAFRTLVSYEYNDLGRLKTKRLDPDAGGLNGGLEALNYSYNLQHQITGINKDYALKNPSNYDKWGHFFGQYIGFDNKDNVFAAANLTGKVSGLLWNTQGDDAQRRYDYTYDNADRLVNAVFTEKQHTGDAWSSNQMDFSITGTSGKITYDHNGNLLNMLHKGVIPGIAAPLTVDNLTYTYASYSNKLQSVIDQMTNTSFNGQLGDFKDGTNGGAPDYVYDANGNVVIDLNKNAKELSGVAGANGIKYNFLDKPEEIRIAGKGTIRIVYNADGRKLQRLFTPEPGSTTFTTTYINQFVYQEVTGGSATLQFINFEEGRVRVIQPTSQGNGLDALIVDGNIDLPNGKRGAYDFFIKDYQANVRMVLTEEIHIASNTATMETNRATLEESIFGQTGGNNEVAVTRYPAPSTWQNSNIGSSVSRLGTYSGHNIGPNSLQKVMAGDKISATVQYYFQLPAGGNNSNFVSTVTSSLLQAITGGNATGNLVKTNAGAITTQLNGVTGFINAVQPNGPNSGSSTPQAFLTVIFFDERFNFIPAADGGVAQQQVAASVGTNGDILGLTNIKAPKNGYAYIYISNQSNNDVFFDNLQVGITAGNIIEENHYYSYGLRIAAISSKKLGDSYEGLLKNNYLYNEKELFDDADLNWYDYGFRNYDPQIGRFPQLDPLTDAYPFLTPFQYASCDPITNIDIDGLEGGSAVGGVTNAVRDFSYIYNATSTLFLPPVRAAATTVSATASIATGVGKAISFASMALHVAGTTGNLINSKIGTSNVGSSTLAGPGPDGEDDVEAGWQPLDKATLENYVRTLCPTCSPGAFQVFVGKKFEEAWNIVARKLLANDNYSPNKDKQGGGGVRKTVPDGMADGRLNRVGGPIIVAEAAWFEVKAMNDDIYNSTSTNQTLAHITNLAAKVPHKYRFYGPLKASAASLTFITTDDVSISPGVITTATIHNIIIYQYKAEYKMTAGGFMTIRFKMKSKNGIGFTGPTTTPVVLR